MFTNVRYFIKTSIIFLIVGILTGLYMAVKRYIFAEGYSQELVSAHMHLLLVGFMLMLIMGVAIWFFPRAEKTDKRYDPDRIRIVYWLMTIGTSLRFIFSVFLTIYYVDFNKWMIALSSTLQVIAIILYFYTIWGRIRPVGSQIREERGEKF